MIEETTPEAVETDAPTGPEPLPEIAIDDLPPRWQKACQGMGWSELMPVQAKSIPYLLAGRDVMVQSRTGSGKTGAFLIPILERITADRKCCQALVLVPTRELARQVFAEAEALTHGSNVRSVAVYGGVGYGPQLDALQAGAHLVIGTPGRILDHLLRRSLILDNVHTLVFDEADRMLSVGFYPDMKAMATYLPDDRDGFMFSATYPPSVRSLANQFLKNPEMINLSSGAEHALNTEHMVYEVPAMDKDRCLVRLIELKNPDSAIIFCNTKAMVRFVSVVLQRFGYDADQLSADLTQSAREKVLSRVYKKELRFLVATDVAARGIDISDLSHVFLYDFPEDPESYIHRTGRTGRAGASGEAVSLVDPLEKLQLKAVARQYGIDMNYEELPTDEDVETIVAERVTALLENKLRNLDGLVRERMKRMLPLAHRLAEHEEEQSVVAMLLDEYYQKMLHEPPDGPPVYQPPTAESSAAHGSGRGGPGGRRSGRPGRRRKGRR